MFSFDTKKRTRKVWRSAGQLSACQQRAKDAPLGQRQGGVFRLPPSLPLDSTHPQQAKGCTPLTILKKKSKHKKLALRQSALSL